MHTIPGTICSCGLKHLKTYLQSTMGSERMDGVAAMQFHYDVEIEFDAVIDMFARKHTR